MIKPQQKAKDVRGRIQGKMSQFVHMLNNAADFRKCIQDFSKWCMHTSQLSQFPWDHPEISTKSWHPAELGWNPGAQLGLSTITVHENMAAGRQLCSRWCSRWCILCFHSAARVPPTAAVCSIGWLLNACFVPRIHS